MKKIYFFILLIIFLKVNTQGPIRNVIDATTNTSLPICSTYCNQSTPGVNYAFPGTCWYRNFKLTIIEGMRLTQSLPGVCSCEPGIYILKI
jgi:hypothetical protein